MKFSADLDVGETFDLSVGLVPQVSVGLSALGGIVSASVFLNFEAALDLDGSISSTTNPQPCLSGGADINVEVGAQGSFFGLFNPTAGISLFNKNFPLFQVCSHVLLYSFFEYLSFLLNDDSNASRDGVWRN